MITIEGYTDIVRIGQGGLGDVYRATRASTGGTVAIKVLRDVSDESVAWHRTRRELTALVSLAGHANVIQLLELLELEQGPALVMEYAPGGSVADLMRRRDATLTVGETVLVGRHTAAALVAAHEQGIVHRDIKPQNLLIDAYGQVKLCDFGVASLTRSDDFRARTSALSMRYASPEDLDDDVDVGPASDVYSLGATLLHLARGAPPTLKERLAPWEPPSTDDADAAALDAVISACLHPDPDRRPTAGEVFDDLERLGWAVDERQRALAFELPFVGVAADDLPTDPHPGRTPDRLTGSGATTGDHDVADDDPVDDGGADDGALDDVAVDDDPTVQRPWAADVHVDDTVRPAPSRPVPPPPRRWQPWVAVAVLAVVIAVPAVVLWPTDDPAGTTDTAETADTTGTAETVETVETVDDPRDDALDDPDPTAASPATSLPAIASTLPGTTPPPDVDVLVVDRPAGLDELTGDGVVWPFGPVGECLVQRAGRAELVPVACDDPHDLQRFVVGELDADRFPPGAPFAQAESRALVRETCEASFEDFTGVALADSRLEVPFTMPSEASWNEGDRRYQCLVFVPGRRIVGDAGAIAG